MPRNSLPTYYQTHDETVWDELQDATNWGNPTASGERTFVSDNPPGVDVDLVSRIKIPSASGTVQIWSALISPMLDLSGTDSIGIWIKFEVPGSYPAAFNAQLWVRDVSDNYGHVTMWDDSREGNWIFMTGVKAEYTAGAFDWSQIKYFRLDFIHTTGVSDMYVRYSSLMYGYRSAANVLIIWDDNNDEQYSIGEPITTAYEVVCNCAVITGTVGAATKNTKAQLLSLQNDSGWSMLNHTSGNDDLTTLTSAQQIAAITEGQEWLESNGFPAVADCLVLPGGQTDAAVKSSVTQSGVRSVIYAGSTSLFNFFAPTGFADKMLIRRNNASKTVATQDTLDAIDSAITRGQTIVLMLHDIDSGGVGEILSSELTAICAHIKLRMDQGLINNPNYADWINI